MYVPLDYSTGSKAEALFRRDAARLERTQAEVLMRFLDGARKSEFARRHGLERVRTVREFRDAVPLAGYDAFAEDIDRMLEGAQGVLFDAPPQTFVLTSGTSGRSKIVPWRALRNSELAGTLIDVGVREALLHHDHPGLDEGMQLLLAGGVPRGKIPFGGAQWYAATYRTSAEMRRRAFVDPAWLEVLTDTPTRFYVLARLALGADIRCVSALSNALLILARTLRTETERLVRDVRDGTITADLTPEARRALPDTPPDPALADALVQAMGSTGAITPRVAWPRLAYVQAMVSASLGNNQRVLRETYGVPVREAGYACTEAPALAFAIRDEDPNLLLAIHRAFCEFVDDAGVAHLAHEVEVGQTYRLALTTPHGLYRYDTGDLLQITGHELGGAPVVRFMGRSGSWNLMGEKLSEQQVLDSVRRAVAAVAPTCALGSFTLIPRPPRKGAAPHYELVVEESPGLDDAAAFCDAIEAAFVATNITYEAYRGGDALGRLRVRCVAPSWFERLREHLQTLSDSPKLPVFLAEEKLPKGAEADS